MLGYSQCIFIVYWAVWPQGVLIGNGFNFFQWLPSSLFCWILQDFLSLNKILQVSWHSWPFQLLEGWSVHFKTLISYRFKSNFFFPLHQGYGTWTFLNTSFLSHFKSWLLGGGHQGIKNQNSVLLPNLSGLLIWHLRNRCQKAPSHLALWRIHCPVLLTWKIQPWHNFLD